MLVGPKLSAILLTSSLLAAAVRAGAQSASGATADAALAQAQALIDQGKNDQAIALLDGIARTAPQTPGLEAKLGKAYYQKRDYMQASSHLEAALKQKPDDSESTQLLGLSYFQLGHLQQAITLLEDVQSRMPRPDVNGSYLLGDVDQSISFDCVSKGTLERALFEKIVGQVKH